MSPALLNAGNSPQRLGGLRYGLLGLPLAFVALPLYVHLPHLYANRYGVPLATLGLVLLLARLLDALTDPWLGRLGDHLQHRSSRHVLLAGGLSALVLLAGMGLLFFPPWADPAATLPLMLTLMLTYAAYSLLAITHQAWGARLGRTELERTRLFAWREGAGLLGVVLASVLPALLGWDAWLAVFALALALGWLAWTRCAQAPPTPAVAARGWHQELLHPWRYAQFRRLLLVFVVSGMASAIPATLVLFFIKDRLDAAPMEPVFLASYFVAAAASLPLWMRAVVRWGIDRTWLAGMLLSVLVFAWAASLGQGNVLAFWWVCVLSGMALGTDLALPGALLAGMIEQHGDRGQREGAYFGWWNLASKLNLALAAGLALPLLDQLGYQPGSTTGQGLQALSIAYAVLPCLFKVLAAVGLYFFFVRHSMSQVSTQSRKEVS